MSSITWSAIDWISLVALSLFVGALITALLFALGFAAWSYSLHDSVTHAVAMFGLPGRG
jgi:hypothetical protein